MVPTNHDVEFSKTQSPEKCCKNPIPHGNPQAFQPNEEASIVSPFVGVVVLPDAVNEPRASQNLLSQTGVVGKKRNRDSLQVDSSLNDQGNPSLARNSPGVPPRPRRSWGRRSVSWAKEEDALLVELVQKEIIDNPNVSSFKTWSRVAAQLNNRTGKQCRERYLNQLQPGIRRDPWTYAEECILHEAHEKYGNKWVAIASELPGRTDNCVKNHWNSMLRKRQRRDATLKAAVREVNAALSLSHNGATIIVRPMSSQPGSTNMYDHGHACKMECSIHRGSVTPSGLSHVERPISPGVPSPLTFSSPITPKRDAKLQIASLVSNHNNMESGPHVTSGLSNSCGLSKPAVTSINEWRSATPCGSGSYLDVPMSSAAGERVIPRSSGYMNGIGSAAGHCDGGYSDKRVTPIVITNELESRFLSPARYQNSMGATQHGACHLTSNWSGSTFSCETGHEIVQNTNALSNHYNQAQVSGSRNVGADRVGDGQQRDEIFKCRRLSERDPLATLAIAASSVPPSPVTPGLSISRANGNGIASPRVRPHIIGQPGAANASIIGRLPFNLVQSDPGSGDMAVAPLYNVRHVGLNNGSATPFEG